MLFDQSKFQPPDLDLTDEDALCAWIRELHVFDECPTNQMLLSRYSSIISLFKEIPAEERTGREAWLCDVVLPAIEEHLS